MIEIPPLVPPGIEDPNDLAYGKRSNFGIARWDDPEFHDRLAWLLEQVTVTLSVDYYTPRGGDPSNPVGFRLPVKVVFTEIGGVSYETEAYDVRYMPHVPLVALKSVFNREELPQIEMYPGIEVRHPANGDPVGGPWPYMEKRWGRKPGTLFMPSSQDGPQFGYDRYDAPFSRSDGSRFVKHRWVVGSNGFSVEFGDVWEKV